MSKVISALQIKVTSRRGGAATLWACRRAGGGYDWTDDRNRAHDFATETKSRQAVDRRLIDRVRDADSPCYETYLRADLHLWAIAEHVRLRV